MSDKKMNKSQNAWSILGIEKDADEQQIRSAYLRKVREFPPERSPEQFELVRDAYEHLKDPDYRARQKVLMPDLPGSFVELFERSSTERKFAPTAIWQQVLKERISAKSRESK